MSPNIVVAQYQYYLALQLRVSTNMDQVLPSVGSGINFQSSLVVALSVGCILGSAKVSSPNCWSLNRSNARARRSFTRRCNVLSWFWAYRPGCRPATFPGPTGPLVPAGSPATGRSRPMSLQMGRSPSDRYGEYEASPDAGRPVDLTRAAGSLPASAR